MVQHLTDAPIRLQSFELDGNNVVALDRYDELLDLIVGRNGQDVVSLLQDVQAAFGFLPRNVVTRLARRAGVRLHRFFGVATFYSGFFLEPRGRYIVRVCEGTACHVAGASQITEALSDLLGIAAGETTADRAVTLEAVACVGCCSLAPVMTVGDQAHARLARSRAVEVVETLIAGSKESSCTR